MYDKKMNFIYDPRFIQSGSYANFDQISQLRFPNIPESYSATVLTPINYPYIYNNTELDEKIQRINNDELKRKYKYMRKIQLNSTNSDKNDQTNSIYNFNSVDIKSNIMKNNNNQAENYDNKTPEKSTKHIKKIKLYKKSDGISNVGTEATNTNFMKRTQTKLKNNHRKQLSELTESLNIFKNEFNSQINSFKGGKDKINVAELSNEIDIMKINHKKQIEVSNKKRDNEFSKFIEEMKNFRNDISVKLEIKKEKYQASLISMTEELNEMKNQMNERISSIEKSRQDQLQKVKLILSDQSPRKKFLIPKENIPEIQNNLKSSLKQDNPKLIKKISFSESFFPSLKKTSLNIISEAVEHERNENTNNFLSELSGLIEKKKSFIIQKIPFNSTKTKKCLRSIVYLVIFIDRIKKSSKNTKNSMKSKSLNYFIENYKDIEIKTQEYIISSLKSVIKNISESPDLNLNLCESYDFEKKDEIYSMLEVRIDSIFKDLATQSNLSKIDDNFKNFIQILTSDFSCVPSAYYSYFEKNRITFNSDKCLINLNSDKKKMIMCYFIFIRNFINEILMLNRKNISMKTEKIKKNFKMVASVIYHCVNDYFNKIIMISLPRTKSISFSKVSTNNLTFVKVYNEKYSDSYTKMRDQTDEIEKKKNKEFLNCYQKILEVLTDKNKKNGFDDIENFVYSKSKMEEFNRMAIKNDFKIDELLKEFIDKFYNVIYK